MSIKALAWAWDYQTKDPLEKLVLLCVADHMNDSMGQAWPSVQRICELCGCSRATVKRKLKQLEDAGVIHRQKRFNKTDIVVMTFIEKGIDEGRAHCETAHSEPSNSAPEGSHRATNPYNTLTLITTSEKRYQQSKKRERVLSDKQKAFAHTLADRLWQKYKAEGFRFQPILDDVEVFLLTDQSEDAWLKLGNGLPKPI
jgi:DNA-binding MarR family transcriptional regulator